MLSHYRSPWSTLYVDNREGIVLVMTLMLIAVLTIAGSTAVTISSTDLLLGGAFHASQVAFHNADAGVRDVTSQIPTLIADAKLKLDGTDLIESYLFKPPADFAFDIDQRSTFTRIANTRKYLLQVTGRSRPNSSVKSTVEVVLQRRRALEYGLFAAGRLDLPAQGGIYSYDSRQIKSGHNPTTSTGKVKIATNGVVTAQSGHLDLDVDGDIILGETASGEEAYFTFRESAPDISPPPVKITTGKQNQINLLPGEAIATDPLEVADMIHEAQKRLRYQNHNDRILENHGNRITNTLSLSQGDYYLNTITLGSGKSFTLNAMKGDINLYVDSIVLEDNATFNIITDYTAGKVNIYLGGAATFGTPSTPAKPVLHVTGDASTFRLFSSSSEPITLDHHGDFKGLIYAPYAPVIIRNSSARGYGLLWSHTLDFSTNDVPYVFYTDIALQELFLSRNVEIVSWKELRD